MANLVIIISFLLDILVCLNTGIYMDGQLI